MRINARLWLAPNGDTVSVRSMTPELRARLGIRDELDTLGTDGVIGLAAARALLGKDRELRPDRMPGDDLETADAEGKNQP